MNAQQFRSKTTILNVSKRDMIRRIDKYTRINNSCSCKVLKRRRVQLGRYLEATTARKDSTSRMRTFFVAIDIIKGTNVITQRTHNKLQEYELAGFDSNGTEIRVHIREELHHSNKILFLISSFQP